MEKSPLVKWMGQVTGRKKAGLLCKKRRKLKRMVLTEHMGLGSSVTSPFNTLNYTYG